MSDNSCELAVIGAGISGLGFAHLARKRGINTLVLEAANKVGGCINSHQFEITGDSFWAELGAHTCYNSYGNLLQILEDTHQLETLQAKEKLSYHIQTADGLSSILSQFNFFELLAALPRLWMAKKDGRSVGDYYAAILGRRNFQRVLGPALNAVVCQPAEDFPADSIFRKKPRRKEVLRSYTGPAGLQSLVDGITAQAGLEVRTGSAVNNLELTEQGYRISIAGADPVYAQHIAFAVAPDIAARLLQSSLPQLLEPLSEIQMAEMESVAVVLDKASLTLPPLAGIIGRDDDFYSVVSRDLVPDVGYRAFTFHFRSGRLDDAGKMARICKVLGVDEAVVLDRVSTVNRLPALRLGHQQVIARLDKQLAGMSLALTGNWFTGVSIEDSLVRTAEEFARLFPEE